MVSICNNSSNLLKSGLHNPNKSNYSMKNYFFTLILLLISNLSIAQITFDPGHFINNEGEKIEGFIKNIEWNNNPESFEFMDSENGNKKTYSIDEVAEFKVDRFLFKRFEVDIDRSSNLNSSLSLHKNPDFQKETLFLLLLVEGDANLYSYNDKSLVRYFYSLDHENSYQLVYKKYLRNTSEITTNNLFRQQLSQILKCNSISSNRFQHLSYSKTELTKFFKDYNTCKNPELIYHKETSKGNFLYSIRPGVTLNNFKIDTDAFYANGQIVHFQNTLGIRLGIEVEYVFPINKNKWSLITEPSFIYINDEALDYLGKTSIWKYNSVELPLGIRHHMFLNEHSKIFINASLVWMFQIDSKVTLFDGKDFVFESRSNFALGVGYKFKNKYSFEFQYRTPQRLDFGRGSVDQTAYIDNMALILGYTIF